MAPRNPEQSDNVDTSKILADLAPNNTDLQKTFAGLTKFLRLEVRSTGKTPEVGDIRDAMMASIDAKVSAPDLKGNSQVQAIAMEMKARLYATGESGPKSQEELLKAFAEMNGALSSGIGTNEASQAKGGSDLQRNQTDQKTSSDLANLDFAQLGEKLRGEIKQSMKMAEQARMDTKARQYSEAQKEGAEATVQLGQAFQKNM